VSRTQRLVFLGIALVIAVVAVIVLASSGGDDDGEETATTTATATATPQPNETGTPTETPTQTPTPTPIPTLRAGRERTLTFDKGDTVRFRVVNSEPEEVHVHGYDISAEVAPGKPARFTFRADITGIFEIELEHSGTPLARLRVNP
jgi:hypothetical protein